MRRSGQFAFIVALLAALSWTGEPAAVRGQGGCAEEYYSGANRNIMTCDLGSPNAEGVTVFSALDFGDDLRAFRFRVGPAERAAFLYLGDQWYDLDAALYRENLQQELARWKLVREAATSGANVIQLVRPEKIVERLDPNTSYTVLILAAFDEYFDPSRGYTLRVALGPPVCGTQRDADDRYQVALSIVPDKPGPFDLMSFNAALSPPYTDLFDFEWWIDGRPVPGDPRETIQRAVTDLEKTPTRQHRVQVTARGARPYPDPDRPQIPPTLSVECSFSIT